MNNEKACIKCKEIKPLAEFGKSKGSKDGLRGDCKNCRYLSHKEWCKNNPDKVIENRGIYRRDNKEAIALKKKIYNKANADKIYIQRVGYRDRNSDHLAKYNKEYFTTDEGKKSVIKSKNKYPNAYKSRKYFFDHKSSPYPNNCEECKSESKVQAHHHDYNLPMEVAYLCKTCHSTWHRTNTPLNREAGIFTENKK